MASTSSRMPIGTKAPRSPEPYRTLHERTLAAEILQSYEQLSWHSFARNESPMQTRLHFQNVIAGFTPDDEARMVYWKDDLTPHPPKPGESGNRSHHRKGKERASLGGNGSGVRGSGGGAGTGDASGPNGSHGSPRGKSNEASASAAKKKRKSASDRRD